QDLAKALSPFGQIENAITSKVEGTGLGLPLTKKLVELMHGEFYIQSEQGVGTTITITFPYQQNEIEPDQHLVSKP
ncbi:MAG: ATP-binding protein, partial [Candidatus Jidaibacter sp.]|nr:ATP-binding protein [Candidatus Jidaibacter sp.]